MMNRLLVALVVFILFATTVLADEWSQFRGPDGSGRYEGNKPLPVRWDAETNIAWKTPLPGRGASSPSVFGDRIVLTAYTGYGLDATAPGKPGDLRLHTLCFDRTTGQELWRATTSGGDDVPNATTRRIDHGYATPTAAVDESGVYVYFGVNGLFAFDWDGTERWSHTYDGKTKGFGTATSPLLHGDLVIQNRSIEAGPLEAYDKQSGTLVWSLDEIDSSWSTPTILETSDGKPELIMNHKSLIRGIDPATGEQLWTCEGVDDYVVPVVIGQDGIAYCFSGRQNHCTAIRLGGRGDVTESHRLWVVTDGTNVTSPVLHNGKLFAIHDKGQWLVLDTADGEVLERSRLPYSGRVYPSIVYGDGRFYAQTRDAGLIVLKAQTEYEELAVNMLEPDTLWNAGPALVDGMIYLRSDRTLYAIGSD